MVEYALILVLVAIAFGITLAATGPAIANVFNNAIYSLVDETPGAVVEGVGTFGAPAPFWATVTWIAGNPQLETPFSTPFNLPASPTFTPPASSSPVPTLTPSMTYTASATFTLTPSPTNTATFTPGPSPTPSDKLYTIPYYNRMDTVEDWRLDRSIVFSAAGWNADFYPSTTFTGSPITVTVNQIDATIPAGAPPLDSSTGWNPADTDYSVVYTQTFSISEAQTVRIDIESGPDDNSTLLINSSTQIAVGTGARSAVVNFPAGTNTIEFRFADTGGAARAYLNIERVSDNPSDVTSQPDGCTWGMLENANDSNSPRFMADENPASDTWPAGQTCYLEFRGRIDPVGATHPRLVFWDIWDFTGAGSVTAELQITTYTVDGNGFFDRSNWTGPNARTVPLHTAGSANYNWTRYEIDVAALGISGPFTYRWVLGSPSGGTVRWYIDDVQVINRNPNFSLTVGNAWNLNSRNQMDDFFFNAESNRLAEVAGNTPPSTEWRWDLTSTNARSGTAWDDSPGYNYPVHSQGGPRVQALEFEYPIDVSASRVPPPPPVDADGDTGDPVLSFYHAYDIGLGASLQVQYTRDPLDNVPDNWTVIPTEGMLLNFTGTSTGGRNETTVRTNLTMSRVEVVLSAIPNWDSQPFRLRFALVVNAGATPAQGWYIDDIAFERRDEALYAGYPFIDNVENAAFSTANWDNVLGWGRELAGAVLVAHSGSYAYADTPNTDYAANTSYIMEMARTLDLLRDSPLHTPDVGEPAGRAPAVNPVISFYWRGDLQDTEFYVDVHTELGDTWTPIWTYTQSGQLIQNAWEYVEIDLRLALEQALRSVTGDSSWQWGGTGSTSITGNSDLTDDDIRVRFRLETGGETRSGIVIDDIRIGEYDRPVHRLWDAGDGPILDLIESASPTTLGATVTQRWLLGGYFGINTDPSAIFSGAQSLADRFPFAADFSADYLPNQFAALEFAPAIDLTNTPVTAHPMLSFYTRYQIGTGDTFVVQVARRNASDTSQGFRDLAGWDAWQTIPYGTASSVLPGPSVHVNTLHQARVDLTPFIGQQIRVRFLFSSNATGLGDGIALDNIAIRYAQPVYAPGATLDADDTTQWILEGNWGRTAQYVSPGINSTSFTDSPNTPPAYAPVPPVGRGYSSVGLNGVFDLTGTTAPQLTFRMYGNIDLATTLSVQYSADGGLTWASAADFTNYTVLPVSDPLTEWDNLTIPIDAAYRTDAFTFRFLMDTRLADSVSGDGVWITDIAVTDP
jgi:hypothetical protein